MPWRHARRSRPTSSNGTHRGPLPTMHTCRPTRRENAHMNENAANTVAKRQKAPRLRGRSRVGGKLAERLGQELQRSRLKQGLDLTAAAELAQTTAKRLGEIEEGATT